jgi:hypothetical protein
MNVSKSCFKWTALAVQKFVSVLVKGGECLVISRHGSSVTMMPLITNKTNPFYQMIVFGLFSCLPIANDAFFVAILQETSPALAQFFSSILGSWLNYCGNKSSLIQIFFKEHLPVSANKKQDNITLVRYLTYSILLVDLNVKLQPRILP